MAKQSDRIRLSRSSRVVEDEFVDEEDEVPLENLISSMRLHLLSPSPQDDQAQRTDDPSDRSVKDCTPVPQIDFDAYLANGTRSRSLGEAPDDVSVMTDRRVPFGDLRNSCPRLTSPFYANLHQKYPHIFKKNVGGELDNVYQNGDAFLKAKQGQGLKEMIQGQTACQTQGQAIKQVILGQGQNQGLQSSSQEMENNHVDRSCRSQDLTNRPASPYRRTQELQAQLTQILYKKDKSVSRTSESTSLRERMRMNRDAVRQSQEPTALRRKSSDPSTLRSNSCGAPSIRQRLEHNKETMKKLTQNSPFVKSRSNSVEIGTWGIYDDSELMGMRLKSQGHRKSLPDSMNQYVYKQFPSNQNQTNIPKLRSHGSRSGVFNAGQTIPIRQSDQLGLYPDDSDSAMDSDSVHSLDGATGTEDEVLLQMLCNDLVKGTNGAGQRDSDVDSGFTNGATDNLESTSSNDSDILNRAMYQPPRPSSVPVGSQYLRPSSRQPFKMLKTGPMKADHNIQPITVAGCMSNRADDLDTEVAYFNAHDQAGFHEKENLYKPCVKTSSNRKRNSPTPNLRVRFQDECHQSGERAAGKKPRSDGRVEDTSPVEERKSCKSPEELEYRDDFRNGHETHRASVVMVLENIGCRDNMGQVNSQEDDCSKSDVEPMLVSSSSDFVHSGLNVTVVGERHLQGSDGDCESETDSSESVDDNSRTASRSSEKVQDCEQGKTQEHSSDIKSDNHKPETSITKSDSLKNSNSLSKSEKKCANPDGADSLPMTRGCPSVSSQGALRSRSCGPVIPKHHSDGNLKMQKWMKPTSHSEGHLRQPVDSEKESDRLHHDDVDTSNLDDVDYLSPDRRTSCFGSNLQASKNLSGSRTSLSEKMDNFKAKAKTRFNTLRRAVSLESLDRKSHSGSVDFSGPAKETSGLKKAPSLSSLFKFGSAKKKKTKPKSRPSTPVIASGSPKPTNLTRGNTPVRPTRYATPDPISPPTSSCLPISGSKLGRALKMRSHSLTDVSSLRVEDLRHFRPIGKLVSLNMDGSQTILLNKPAHGPFGFYIARGTSKYKHGIFISRLTDAYPERFFAGLVGIGDEILEINSIKTRNMSLDDVYDVMASRETLLLKIIPLMSRQDI
ncbi:uncharacterized protein LOC135501806 [Lineus longissimus]|uniref:uncharacterized protein LOC135501806 n=1 Tax=Lineus longissimus TaxID=88925 RepID=UPI002B4EF715